jgi:hypothetical protein
MQSEHEKAALAGSWIAAAGSIGYLAGTSSVAGWTLLAMASLAPPVLMVRFWSTPSPTMSETIRKALR